MGTQPSQHRHPQELLLGIQILTLGLNARTRSMDSRQKPSGIMTVLGMTG